MATNHPGMPPNPYAGVPQPSGTSGCKIVAIVLGVVVLLPMCCCGGCFGLALLIGQNPARDQAIAAVKADRTCRDKLGTPIEAELSVDTEKNESIGFASADFDVSGPKGSATVWAEAEKVGDEWVLTYCEVEFNDGEILYLVGEPEEGDEEDDNFRLEIPVNPRESVEETVVDDVEDAAEDDSPDTDADDGAGLLPSDDEQPQPVDETGPDSDDAADEDSETDTQVERPRSEK